MVRLFVKKNGTQGRWFLLEWAMHAMIVLFFAGFVVLMHSLVFVPSIIHY
jgi:hypothetical protein